MNVNDRTDSIERPQSSGTQTGDASDDRYRGDEGFLPVERMEDLRNRWNGIQVGFVDDPKSAVEEAHALVTTTVKELTEIFAGERANLEGQWNGGGQADTETLRVALRRYRVFFNRLLRSDRDDERGPVAAGDGLPPSGR